MPNAPSMTPGRTWDYGVHAAATATYDDNVPKSSRSAAAVRGVTRKDQIYTPHIDLNLSKTFGGRSVAFVSGTVGYQFYARNTQLNSAKVDLSAGMLRRLGMCQTEFGATYSRNRYDLPDQNVATITDVYTQKAVSASARCGRSTGLAPTASVSQAWADNSEPHLPDSRTLSTSLGLSYRSAAGTSLSAQTSYERTRFVPIRLPPDTPPSPRTDPILDWFDHPALFDTNPFPTKNGFEVYTAGVSLEKRAGGRLQLHAQAGYTFARGAALRFKGKSYSAGLTYKFGPRLTIDGGVDRKVTPSAQSSGALRIDRTFTAKAAYKLGSRLSLTLNGSDIEGSEQGPVTPLLPLLQQYHQQVATIGLSYSRRRLFGTIEATTEHRTSNAPDQTYSDFRASVTLGTNF